MKRFLALVIAVFSASFSYGTHNRAGEITYQWLSGYTYEITIRICTNEGSNVADRPQLEIYWGDGTRDTLVRLQENPQPSIGSFNGSENIYKGTHTYPGPSTYEIEVLDPNRNQGVLNIDNSVNVAFCIRTILIINPFISIGNNSCIPEQFPCPELGCTGVPYCYNAAAYDPDGDSLSYSLVPCMEGNANNDGCDLLSALEYSYPHLSMGGQGTMTIDQATGTLCWTSPQIQGEYNFAIAITEWKNGVQRGVVIRDIQVTILGNCNNTPPDISDQGDTCVIAGGLLDLTFNITDANNNNVTVEEYGQPFDFTTSPAVFTQNGSAVPTTGDFTWLTHCSHIRYSPYNVYFIAEDNATPVPLIDVTSFYISVNPPPVTGLTASPLGNAMNLTWNSCSCSNIKGYKIYRKTGPGTPVSGCCDENTATAMGYTLVGTNIGWSDTTFTDNSGLVLGQQYCYVVVSYMLDGATSCPSNEVCEELNLDFPIIINVSVGATDAVNGIDTVRWFHPTELDTNSQFPGPYFYRIYQFNGFGNPATVIFTTPSSPTLSGTQDELIVTSAISNPTNTDALPHTYKAELYYTHPVNGPLPVGSTNTASSVFVTLIPMDNAIDVTWQCNVPWTNTLYEVYKETFPGSTVFNLIGTTAGNNYLDTGLINGATYCYKVKSIGSYSSPQIPSPLINWSEEECIEPVDLTPPCPPELTVDSDCLIPINIVSWTNPNNSCADDVMSYNLYYTPVEGEPFTLIMTFNSQFDTTIVHLNDSSVAGCYYVTAVDSAQYGNESDPSNIICVDNCPYYFLPNVFSPNGDGTNDFFIPFPYRYVKDIELRIYNRWGQVIFETNDPDINWNGKHMDNGKEIPEGVYYYFCKVNTIRLSGIEPVELSGFFHLFRNRNSQGN